MMNDCFTESHWNLLQLLAWVYVGDRRLVSEVADGAEPGKFYEYVLTSEGEERKIEVTAPHGSIHIFTRSTQIGALTTYEKAKAEILKELCSGELTASGLRNGDGREVIPALMWHDYDFHFDPSVARKKWAFGPTKDTPEWCDLHFPTAEIFKIWPDVLAAMPDYADYLDRDLWLLPDACSLCLSHDPPVWPVPAGENDLVQAMPLHLRDDFLKLYRKTKDAVDIGKLAIVGIRGIAVDGVVQKAISGRRVEPAVFLRWAQRWNIALPQELQGFVQPTPKQISNAPPPTRPTRSMGSIMSKGSMSPDGGLPKGSGSLGADLSDEWKHEISCMAGRSGKIPEKLCAVVRRVIDEAEARDPSINRNEIRGSYRELYEYLHGLGIEPVRRILPPGIDTFKSYLRKDKKKNWGLTGKGVFDLGSLITN